MFGIQVSLHPKSIVETSKTSVKYRKEGLVLIRSVNYLEFNLILTLNFYLLVIK